MCNRESFILFPQDAGIPVAWTTSYHHNAITRAARLSGSNLLAMYVQNSHYVQIECLEGNVHKWDWDNIAKKVIHRPVIQKQFTIPAISDSDDIPSYYGGHYLDEYVPDIPAWLEDDLRKYENIVEKILEKLNPIRDRQELILQYMTNYSGVYHLQMRYVPEIEDVISHLPPDSREVIEFQHIVNMYREIPGFVEQGSHYQHPDYYRRNTWYV